MAAYCQVYGVIHFTSPVGWLPVHRDQLRAQRSVTSMGKTFYFSGIGFVYGLGSAGVVKTEKQLHSAQWHTQPQLI